MSYQNLQACIEDLYSHGMLKIIEEEIDPCLDMGMIQRRAYFKRSPALLFTHPRNCVFPMLANLFGTMERLEFIFRDSLEEVKKMFEIAANPASLLKNPFSGLSLIKHLTHMRPKRKIRKDRIPILQNKCKISNLPHLQSWPQDGGAFITLPLVYSEDPDKQGSANLGMYRVQISGNNYGENEVGLHYQVYRGIGPHHSHALARGKSLPVHIYAGGPPALIIAAIMPLPFNMNEMIFAGLLGGRRMEIAYCGFDLPVLSQADFLLQAEVGKECKPEGPFGDHLGYYSLEHPFPVARVKQVYHKNKAVWPFTTVGRPPQEDTVFGTFIHELTRPLVGKVFEGIREIHAVDAAGVHPLLLAIGKERYTPYKLRTKPEELLTLAMHLLGKSQTSLAKYLLIIAEEDAPGLSCSDISGFILHLLERTDFTRDLHFISNTSADTLDYSGGTINEGSRLIWAACGNIKRELGTEISGLPDLPDGFTDIRLFQKGILVIKGPENNLSPGLQDDRIINKLIPALRNWRFKENFPLVLIVDDPQFCVSSLENFLWVCFTRSDPATDTYGINARMYCKQWLCDPPLIIDARKKKFHAPPLVEDPEAIKRVEKLAKGSLKNII